MARRCEDCLNTQQLLEQFNKEVEKDAESRRESDIQSGRRKSDQKGNSPIGNDKFEQETEVL